MNDQRQQWDTVAAGWQQWWPTIEASAQHVSQRMLEMARVEPGQRLLDIATGIGEPALRAAGMVGATGRVVATDLSSAMLDIARQRAAALGLTNVEFVQVSADQMDFPDDSFDAVLCRWGVTSLPNPEKLLSAVRRMLKPHGSFTTAIWEAGPQGRPLANLAMAVAQEVFDLPLPTASPASPGSASVELELQLIQAGFTDIRTEPMTLTLEWPSTDDCIQYLVDVSPDLVAVLSGKRLVQQGEYRQRLTERLQQYVTGDGSVVIPNIAICGVGRR